MSLVSSGMSSSSSAFCAKAPAPQPIASAKPSAPAITRARALRPSELGGKSLFGDLWGTMTSSFSDKPEVGTFSGEPTRENLTAPPTGYQTPSPNQPYGLSPKKKATGKALTVEDRTSGETK